jgi:hypothetical protein
VVLYFYSDLDDPIQVQRIEKNYVYIHFIKSGRLMRVRLQSDVSHLYYQTQREDTLWRTSQAYQYRTEREYDSELGSS